MSNKKSIKYLESRSHCRLAG